jgi:methylase of polypeptide subunit release factors
MARRGESPARDLRDVFGWNLPFPADLLPPLLRERLAQAEIVVQDGERCRSRVRVSSIGSRLFAHSAYPTIEKDAVFLGPDSYRFVNFVQGELKRAFGIRHLVDLGTGAGVGAIMAHDCLPDARLTLVDINPLALRFAAVNARHAGIGVELLESGGLDGVARPFDLVIANPPFIADAEGRTYRDGGAMHGAAVSLEWALSAVKAVAPGGRVLLYTGSAIVDGKDPLEAALRAALPELGCWLRYAELDPDIFGEELDQPGYDKVERIAAVGAVMRVS